SQRALRLADADVEMPRRLASQRDIADLVGPACEVRAVGVELLCDGQALRVRHVQRQRVAAAELAQRRERQARRGILAFARAAARAMPLVLDAAAELEL